MKLEKKLDIKLDNVIINNINVNDYVTKDEYNSKVEELNITKEDLIKTETELSKSQLELDSTKEILIEKESELNSTKDELSETQSELSNTKIELDNAKETLTSTQSELNSTKSELDEVTEDLNEANTKIEELKENVIDWSEIGYQSASSVFVSAFDYAKEIYDKWDNNTTWINHTSDTKLIYFPLVDTSNVTSLDNSFANCFALQTIPAIDTSNVTNMANMFTNCTALQTIPAIDTSNVTTVDSMFKFCNNLESLPLLDFSNVEITTDFLSYSWDSNMIISDIAGFYNLHVDFDISNCNNLAIYSILNIFEQAADLSTEGKTATLTLGATNIAKLSEEQIAIATLKGWTIA